MVDFDVILSMDRLHVCYDSVDCRYRVVMFHFPNLQVFEWSKSSVVPMGHYILYMRARYVVLKSCRYHLVQVNETSVRIPLNQSISAVKEFLEVF